MNKINASTARTVKVIILESLVPVFVNQQKNYNNNQNGDHD